jgi:hypothetical protein
MERTGEHRDASEERELEDSREAGRPADAVTP